MLLYSGNFTSVPILHHGPYYLTPCQDFPSTFPFFSSTVAKSAAAESSPSSSCPVSTSSEPSPPSSHPVPPWSSSGLVWCHPQHRCLHHKHLQVSCTVMHAVYHVLYCTNSNDHGLQVLQCMSGMRYLASSGDLRLMMQRWRLLIWVGERRCGHSVVRLSIAKRLNILF